MNGHKDDIKKHKTTSNTWCDICCSSFVTQERLNLHLKKNHNKIVKTDRTHNGESFRQANYLLLT